MHPTSASVHPNAARNVGWYRQGAGFIAATLGAIAVSIWNRLVVNQTIRDPGNPRVPGPGPTV